MSAMSELSQWRLTCHIMSHFRDESFQTIDCTATDNQTQGNKTRHSKRQTNTVYVLANTKQALVW